MARPTISLKIDPKALRAAIDARKMSMTDLATALGVERATLHGWVSKGSIPPNRLSSLARSLSLTGAEVESFKPRKQIDVRFRTLRNLEVETGIVNQVTDLARTVFRLEEHFGAPHIDSYKKLPKVGYEHPRNVAEFLLKQFQLPSYPLSLEQLTRALLVRGIPVVFLPFWEEVRAAKVKAFTAYQDRLGLIFIDSNSAFEDVPWLIIHELTHIVKNDGGHVTAAEEKFCNQVAIEVCTPSEFFDSRKDELRNLLTGVSLPAAVNIVREIADLLGASFRGVVLRAKDAGIFDSKSGVCRYLMTAARNSESRRVLISDLICPKNTDDACDWDALLKDPSKGYLMHLQALVRDGLFQGKISQGKAAEMLGIDESVIAALYERWMPAEDDSAPL
ncbi:MAG: ImmA/IrrE family metallo-endopeptidase [Deltaproteobacteria bacterium]|nr:ImmA/IrrE family metallo-endopeptidase [Deltaproteobacteria bacterium]